MPDLPPPPTTVETVIVRPARLPPSASLGAFSVITLDEADLAGRARIDQALGQAPGASLFRRSDSLAANPTTQGLSLRAIAPSGAGRALVTLDGVPQNDPFGGWVIWASMPPESIEGASIVRGGGAGPYGAGALTGVVALDETSRQGITADARYGERDSGRAAVVVGAPLAGGGLTFTGAGSRTDGFVPVRIGAGAVDTALSVQEWSASLRYALDLGDAVLAARLGAYDEARGSGLLGARARASGETASLTLAKSPAGGELGWRVQGWVRSSDLYNSSVAVAANRATTTPSNIQYETPATGLGFNAAVRSAGTTHEWELGADLRHASGQTRELFTYNATTRRFSNTRVAGGDAFVGGLYAEGVKKAGDWLFTGGARIDQWQSSNAVRLERLIATGAVTLDQPSPNRDGFVSSLRAGVRRDLGEGYVRAAAYTGFRAPTLNELHRPFRVGNRTTLANPDLEPETLSGVEGGFGFEGETSSVAVTVFVNRLEDAITNVTIVPNVTLQRRNAGTVEAVGVEIEADHRVTETLRLRAALGYTDAETETGLRPAQAPRTTITAGAEWWPIAPLLLDVRVRHEDKRFEDDLNLIPLAAATSVDFRASWAWSENAETYLSVSNALDEDIETGQTSGIVSYGAPRSVNIGLTLRR